MQFVPATTRIKDVLGLGNGTSGQDSLISQYSNILKKYDRRPMEHPVIILCDNDEGAGKVFNIAKNKTNKTISKTTTDPFYYLGENLYLVKVPEGTPPIDRDIEDLFQPALLATVLEGKPFDKKKDHGDETAYGKVIFAQKVVRANASTVDFSGFSDLLSRIVECLEDYKKRVPVALPAAASRTP